MTDTLIWANFTTTFETGNPTSPLTQTPGFLARGESGMNYHVVNDRLYPSSPWVAYVVTDCSPPQRLLQSRNMEDCKKACYRHYKEHVDLSKAITSFTSKQGRELRNYLIQVLMVICTAVGAFVVGLGVIVGIGWYVARLLFRF